VRYPYQIAIALAELKGRTMPMRDSRVRFAPHAALLLGVIMLGGCEDLQVRDPSSLLIPRLQRSELVGLVAGFGTTFAAVPDLIKMLKRRSCMGFSPTMAGIMAAFQVLWVYYGLLIASRPVVAWNTVAVGINLTTVIAYYRFARNEKKL
jgi:MtN3 and saliva related transmembrane protein